MVESKSIHNASQEFKNHILPQMLHRFLDEEMSPSNKRKIDLLKEISSVND